MAFKLISIFKLKYNPFYMDHFLQLALSVVDGCHRTDLSWYPVLQNSLFIFLKTDDSLAILYTQNCGHFPVFGAIV